MKSQAYADEKIVRLQQFYREKAIPYNPFREGFPVNGKTVRFVPCSLFGGRLHAWIPEGFTEMPERIAEVRYISNWRPPVILTNDGYDENFGFHLLERREIEGEGLEEWTGQMQEAVLRHAPGTVLYGKGSIDAKGGEGRWFEYKNFTLDDETYNLQFLMDFKIHVLAGTFNCMMCDYDQWKEPVLESLGAMEFNMKEEWGNESR